MKKFVIVNNKRSGSGLLESGLRDNKNIKTFGEIFPENPLNRHPRHLYQEGRDGATFLQEDIFHNNYSKEIKTVGFKLLYTQAHYNIKVKTAWKYLIDNKDIYIIHLTRKNMLESWLSSKIALMSGQYALQKNDNDSSTHKKVLAPFNADPKECEAHFRFVTDFSKWIRVKFKSHPLIEIEYEELVSNFEEMLFNIQEFLSVSPVVAKKHLEKQSTTKPSEQLLNFTELKEYFFNSPYEKFFQVP